MKILLIGKKSSGKTKFIKEKFLGGDTSRKYCVFDVHGEYEEYSIDHKHEIINLTRISANEMKLLIEKRIQKHTDEDTFFVFESPKVVFDNLKEFEGYIKNINCIITMQSVIDVEKLKQINFDEIYLGETLDATEDAFSFYLNTLINNKNKTKMFLEKNSPIQTIMKS